MACTFDSKHSAVYCEACTNAQNAQWDAQQAARQTDALASIAEGIEELTEFLYARPGNHALPPPPTRRPTKEPTKPQASQKSYQWRS
jgi:hypothetical protein